LLIEPDTEIVQGHLGGQARLKTAELMRVFAIEPRRVGKFIIDGLDSCNKASRQHRVIGARQRQIHALQDRAMLNR
jgi:hypothetical protein